MFHKHVYVLTNARYLRLSYGGTGNGDERFSMSTVVDGRCNKCHKHKTLTYLGEEVPAKVVEGIVDGMGWIRYHTITNPS